MKTGLTLTDMATELERQQATKHDYVAANAAIEMLPDTRIALKDTGEFKATDYTHSQIATYTAIPKPYYDRLRSEEPSLLATNVNRWLHDVKRDVKGETTNGDRRMLRTLDGNARAFLSNRYRPLDNFDIASAALPVLLGDKSMRIESSALTETRMYIKAVTTRLEAEVKTGDVVQMGISISNSDQAFIKAFNKFAERFVEGRPLTMDGTKPVEPKAPDAKPPSIASARESPSPCRIPCSSFTSQ